MPELPEVETVVRDLRPLITGRTIGRVRCGTKNLRRPWQAAWTTALNNARILSLARRGKWILLHLDCEARLLLHLGMTGQLTVHAHDDPPADHVHLALEFENGRELRFRDVRRFGSATLFESTAALEAYLNERLGPEPFGLDAGYFRKKLAATNRPLKAVLLDQLVVAGVGNIYADESCFRARLHPGRRADTLSTAEVTRLRKALEDVLTQAVTGRGSTIRDYVGGSGLKGSYQDNFAVYGRTGKPCPRCGAAIEMQRIAGRSSHYCRFCQGISPRSPQSPPRKPRKS